jgi:hypothetical protein
MIYGGIGCPSSRGSANALHSPWRSDEAIQTAPIAFVWIASLLLAMTAEEIDISGCIPTNDGGENGARASQKSFRFDRSVELIRSAGRGSPRACTRGGSGSLGMADQGVADVYA